jgi:hypothetical protein
VIMANGRVDGPEASSVADALGAALDRAETDALPLGRFLDAFGERAFGLMLILLSLPNCLLAPPVVATATAGPIGFLGAQMLAGRRQPWLPEVMRGWSLPVPALRRVLAVAGPCLRRVEALRRPRAPGAIGSAAERLAGLFALLAALIVLLPVPGTNVLPALSLVLLSLGLLRRDGLLFLLGVGLGLAGVLVATAAAGLAVELLRWAWRALAP